MNSSASAKQEEDQAAIPQERVLAHGKALADLLTLSRVFVAAVILVAALTRNEQLLVPVVLLTMVGWTTDILDGCLASADAEPRKTWIGDHDFVADMLMVYGGLVYFMLTGYVPIPPFLLYILFSGAIALIWQKQSYTMAVAAPVVAMPLIFSLLHARFLGWVFAGWIVLALVLFWDRFKIEVRTFIKEVEEE